MRQGFAALVLTWCLGCEAPRARLCDAYVWNRRWTPAVKEAIAARPRQLQALRVLVMETGERAAMIALDESALAGVQVIPVLRVGEGVPEERSWQQFLARVDALRASGVAVGQVEVDFDAPADGLGEYLRWLERTRPSLGGLRRSITALPAWGRVPEVRALSRAVDEVVLQVHTVRAPVLFEPAAALADVLQWEAATERPFRVALPAYRIQLASGEALAADPREVAGTLARLTREPLVSGFVFFRLGNDEDRGAWSLATLAAVLSGQQLEGEVSARLEPVEHGLADLWLDNAGPVDALAPARFEVRGAAGQLIATTGYQLNGARFVSAHPLWLRPGEHLRVGSARGEELHVSIP